MDKILLDKYAAFTVKTAAGVKKGQTVIINSPIETAFFAQMCTKIAYEIGAREVVVQYSDEKVSRMRMEYASEEVAGEIKPYIPRMKLDYLESDSDVAIISIASRNPELYKGIDANKLQIAKIAADKAMEEYYEFIVNDRAQWTIISVPSESWNSKVFPNLSKEEAEEAMWEAIFTCTRVSGGDPEKEWDEFIEKTVNRKKVLNDYNFDAVRMTAQNGTDLTVGLADNHIWDGGVSSTNKGNRFIANVPTEEIFTCPHRERVDGKVYSSKPYIYNGDIIENFYFEFKDGVVVNYGAEVGGEHLKSMMTIADNSNRIGEIAIVDNSSGVGKSGILYYNTLFDENAACHIAFGRCYPTNIKGGDKMSREELEKAGGNYSIIHEDVMVGTSDMTIVGIKEGKEDVTLVKDGFWVI